MSVKQKSIFLIMPLILMSFTQCSSQKKLQKEPPITFGEVYCQSWVAGVKGGGSGINIIIPTDLKSIKNQQLDSVYFRGKSAKLQLKEGKIPTYVGRFKTEFNQKLDINMSGNSADEYGNEVPNIPEKIPFELENNECVVSYLVGNKTKYYKIDNVVNKMPISYPQARPNKQ